MKAPMLSARFMVATAILLTVRAVVAAQGQLVIVTESTKQYHRPSCSIIRDGKQKDIVAMNVGQAQRRGHKPHPACHSDDSANSTSPVTGQSSGEPPRPVFVYTAPNDTRYHKENCARLGKERKKVALEEAGKKLWPCSLCRPPVRKRTSAIPGR